MFPTFSSLHLPVGGDRMRPGLEDVLQLAVCEFGIDVTAGWLDAVEASHEEYRTTQLRAFVREFPDIAFEELRRAGYVDGDVPQRPVREDRISRLRRYRYPSSGTTARRLVLFASPESKHCALLR
ncbi:hypothetical protein [Bifidobacterium callitrichos]|uniref:hypothetical protein n=1 Tax=Bifidobacterium callitrichos TaxID=762209 RepID=UPI0005BE8BB7|nr:hypothetical protein [Bifidobacterium callitrichos]